MMIDVKGTNTLHRKKILQPPTSPNSSVSVETLTVNLKKHQNAPRPSEHPPVRGKIISKRLGGIIGSKYKTSSWHLNGFPYGSNIGSTV